MIGGLLRVLVIALIMLVAALMLIPRPSEPELATVLDEPRALPAVALTDKHGAPFTLSEMAGKRVLLFFGFANCPDVCPLTLAVLADVAERLRARVPAIAPEVVFISVDSERDSPDRIRAYLAGFDENFFGATADDATLSPLLAALGVSVHKQTVDGASYNVVHNGTIYVLDTQGRWTALFGGSEHSPDAIFNDYLILSRRR